jgi:hypothetical protein
VKGKTGTRPTGDTGGIFAGRVFGLLIRESAGEAATPKMGSGFRFGKAGAVSFQARGLARPWNLARAPRMLLWTASGQDSCSRLQAPAYQDVDERPLEHRSWRNHRDGPGQAGRGLAGAVW